MARRHTIDEMDLKILKRLQLDGRISNVQLAEAVHLSPSACLDRVKALEKNGAIKRYIAELDLSKISSFVVLMVEVVLENHREADFERYSEFSDYMSRGELGIEKFHGHVVLGIDKPFQGYPLDMLIGPRGRE